MTHPVRYDTSITEPIAQNRLIVLSDRYFRVRTCCHTVECALRLFLSLFFSVSFYSSVFLVFSFPSHNARLGKRAEKIGLKFQHFHNSSSSREWSESIKVTFVNLKSPQSRSKTDIALWMCLRCSFRVEYV